MGKGAEVLTLLRKEARGSRAELLCEFFVGGCAVCVAIASVAFELEVGQNAPSHISSYRRGRSNSLLGSTPASESSSAIVVELARASVVGVVAASNEGQAALSRKIVEGC